MSIEIIDGADDRAIAGWIADRLLIALARTDRIAITVPGGGTPFPVLAELVTLPVDWRRVEVWPGDDRVVPEGHAASNAGRIRSVLEPAGATVVPLAEGLDPPHFTLTWLGMGLDGHVASLFPSTDPRADDPVPIRRLTPDPLPADAPFERLSLTIPALCNSDALMFMIRGPEKRALFEAAAVGLSDLPVARLLAARRQAVTCFA